MSRMSTSKTSSSYNTCVFWCFSSLSGPTHSRFWPAVVPTTLSHIAPPYQPTHGMPVEQCLAQSSPQNCWLRVVKNMQIVWLLLNPHVVADGGIVGGYPGRCSRSIFAPFRPGLASRLLPLLPRYVGGFVLVGSIPPVVHPPHFARCLLPQLSPVQLALSVEVV